MKSMVAVFLAVAMSVAIAGAQVVVDLSELTGDYSIGGNSPDEIPDSRSTTLVIPESVQSLDALRFLVSGSWTSAQLEQCRDVGGFTICDTIPVATALTLRLRSVALGECHFQASVSAFDEVNGNELMFAVCPAGSVTANQLLNTSITAELFCDVAPDVLPFIVEAAIGTLNEVRLETVGAVPGVRVSWGAAKTRYR